MFASQPYQISPEYFLQAGLACRSGGDDASQSGSQEESRKRVRFSPAILQNESGGGGGGGRKRVKQLEAAAAEHHREAKRFKDRMGFDDNDDEDEEDKMGSKYVVNPKLLETYVGGVKLLTNWPHSGGPTALPLSVRPAPLVWGPARSLPPAPPPPNRCVIEEIYTDDDEENMDTEMSLERLKL
ncbi:hypothetical protein BASA81_002679 [Batrachochytrium salamandrivorans]|nr:hypothetical protein BASA81_002679 [Batrachochytrium salamandrivorans]